MRILLINPPYQTLTARFGTGHQVPLGLLMVGGALLDAGHDVRLLDAEARQWPVDRTVAAALAAGPDIIMTGHAGSTPAHPTCMRLLGALKQLRPDLITIYGGVYPTYHARDILTRETCVDFIIRGEGEATAVELVEALEHHLPLPLVRGIAYRITTNDHPRQDAHANEQPAAPTAVLAASSTFVTLCAPSWANPSVHLTPERPPIADLDAFRIGWELIDDWDLYTCFGLGRAAIVQFSRGCPHRCTYCGQHNFWLRWRHRDPVRAVDEIERLYSDHDVRFVTLADENPTTSQALWKRFLQELARRDLPVHLFATIRAGDIVRDEKLLPLYRAAGLLYILMGIESTDEATIRRINKRSTPRDDLRACHLLRRHGIFSIIGHIVGLGNESWPGTFRTVRRLAEYDGDYLNAMYASPHAWTPFAAETAARPLVEPDPARWDYRHQVLAEPRMRPWELLAAVKLTELLFHLRPRRLWRILTTPDPLTRQQYRWTVLHTSRVWLAELIEGLCSVFRWREIRATPRRSCTARTEEGSAVRTLQSDALNGGRAFGSCADREPLEQLSASAHRSDRQ